MQSLRTWGFDGSSTNQATGQVSDLVLKPVVTYPDPVRGGSDVLVLCEVFTVDNKPHGSNTRSLLRPVAGQFADQEPLFGIEQEYTFFRGSRPLGFPEVGYPAPQGGYYCGVGADEIFGREIVEKHLDNCLAAGLTISGINAEVMPGQWEFQVGPLNPLDVADQLWIARWLLYRTAEDFGVSATPGSQACRGRLERRGCAHQLLHQGDAVEGTTRSSRPARLSAATTSRASTSSSTARAWRLA